MINFDMPRRLEEAVAIDAADTESKEEKHKKDNKNRWIVGLILAGIALPCLFLGGWFFAVLVAVVLFFLVWEVLHAPGKKYKWYYTILL